MDRIKDQLKFFENLGVNRFNIIPTHKLAPTDSLLTLDKIHNELGDCQRCKLSSHRKNIVFGVGDKNADLMFIGEAPGRDEDSQGVPFVGRAGQLLTRIIQSIELNRDQVYIANILKCRPPQNRDPEADEIETCEGFLHKQIASIKPLIIVALGRCAAQTLLRSNTTISNLRGKFFDFQGTLLLPTFHPSYLLRNPVAKRKVWEDMKTVRSRLKELKSRYY